MAPSFDPEDPFVLVLDAERSPRSEPVDGLVDISDPKLTYNTDVFKKGTSSASVPCASSFDPQRSARSEPVDISERLRPELPELVEGHGKVFDVFEGTSGVTEILVPVKVIEVSKLPSILVPVKLIEVTKLPSILVPVKVIEVTKLPSILVPGEGIEVTNSEKDAGEVHIKFGSGPNKIDMSTYTCYIPVLHQIDLWDRNGSKVEEIMVAVTGQAAISLMGYYLNSSTFSAETLFVVGANALGFVGSLSSLMLREKCPRAALVLRKIGAVGASSAMVTAMTMFVPANHKLWVSSVACLLPAIAVAVA